MFSLLPSKCRCLVYILEINPELGKQLAQGIGNNALGVEAKWIGSVEIFLSQYSKTKRRDSDMVIIFVDYVQGEDSGMEKLFLLYNNENDTRVFMLHNINELDLGLYKKLANPDSFILKDENLISHINNIVAIKRSDHILALRKSRLTIALGIWLVVLIAIVIFLV